MSSNDRVGVGNLVLNQDEGLAHNFDFFSAGTLEKSMRRGFEQEIRTTTAVTNDGPYEFFIPESNDYLLLPLTRLYVKVRLTKENGQALPAETEVSVVNLFPHSLFRQVDVEISGVNTSSQDQLYPYKAYLETLLSYPNNELGHLTACSGWHLDEAEKFDSPDNDAFDVRREGLFTERDYCIPIHSDIFQSPKVIPGNAPIKITLTRNTDAFSLICENAVDVKINITGIKLYVRKITPTDDMRNTHIATLQKQDAIIPFSRCVLKKHLISAGTTNVSLSGIFKGVLPRQILMGMVKSSRVDGRKYENPFLFNHYNVNQVNLRIDGQNCPPSPYQPNFQTGMVTRELRALYDNIGVLTNNNGCTISNMMFVNGFTLFAWDLTPDLCNGWHIHENEGVRTVDIDLQFTTAIPDATNIIFFATYESAIRIDKEGNVFAHFNN